MIPITITNLSSHPEKERETVTIAIRSALIQFNLAHFPDTHIEPVILTVNRDSQILGGLIGRIAYDWLHIELLWLDESIRKDNLGYTLMTDAEKIASNKGCTGIYLDTFSFQAPNFYLKMGYEIFGQIDDQPTGNVRYFLKKKLSRSDS